MKKIFFIIALAICPTVFGQQYDQEAALQTAAAELTTLKQQLNLTPEQEVKVKILLEGMHQKIAYRTFEESVTPEQRQENVRTTTEAKHRYMLQYLDEQQQQLYRASFGL